VSWFVLVLVMSRGNWPALNRMVVVSMSLLCADV
jgi:hypothetical protein